MTTGTTLRNGTGGLRASGFRWDEPLTVVRRDPQSLGCERYLVRNDQGRHGYAY